MARTLAATPHPGALASGGGRAASCGTAVRETLVPDLQAGDFCVYTASNVYG